VIAIVTGASRGIGKGCALELGAAGATVYVTGRSVEPAKHALPGTIVGIAYLIAFNDPPIELRRSRLSV
jgi:NAD(P)-dependent dehydrogenase (short-subunit alcohol dehydrogenase family)